MNWIKSIYHFLGSIHLAIILIVSATIIVISGTLIESITDSHLLAAQWTYHHPFFIVLLGFFFINILFSALHRWPFKTRHIPFLITHLGLLMIIAGTILKNKIGLQGNMTILEGAATHSVELPFTHALQITQNDRQINLPVDVNNLKTINQPTDFSDLSIKILAYYPHVKEKKHTWIKKNYAQISGHLPLLVQDWRIERPLEFSSRNLGNDSQAWHVTAVKTDQIQELIQASYFDHLQLKICSKVNLEAELVISLKEATAKPFPFDEGTLTISLDTSYSAINGFEHPSIQAIWQSNHFPISEQITVPLQGHQALHNLVNEESWHNETRCNLDLTRTNPMLVMAQDEHENTHLLFFDCYGRVGSQIFSPQTSDPLIIYDAGYGGYAVQTQIPFPSFDTSRQAKEQAIAQIFANEIQNILEKSTDVVPPLRIFKEACEKAQINCGEALASYLNLWKQSRLLLLTDKIILDSPLEEVINTIEWDEKNLQASQLVVQLYKKLETPLEQGENIIELLKINHWPFSLTDESIPSKQLFAHLAQQLFAIADQLPLNPIEHEEMDKTKLLSAFFRGYGIDDLFLSQYPVSNNLSSEYAIFKEFKNWTPVTIETPIRSSFLKLDPLKKIEDNQACLIVEFSQGKQKEQIALAHDPKGLKWPILNGHYLVRYQAQSVEIPYKIRLRQAREIYYPHTMQAYSYESDVLIRENDKKPISRTLSMNSVYETWDGYRFYLSGMNQASLENIKYVQIAVNHDPVKYLLTYPGGVLVFLGVVLLFWFKPSKS